jgi:hypothetical protein
MNVNNLTLPQIADRLSTVGFIINMEGNDIAKEDLYHFASELEISIAALLTVAKQKEKENAQG